MSDGMDELRQNYENFMKERGRDPFHLFFNETALTEIHRGSPISAARFATIEYETWPLEEYGLDGGLYIKIWQDRKLENLLWTELRHLLYAHQVLVEPGDNFEYSVLWPNGTTEYRYGRVWHKRPWLVLGTHDGKDENGRTRHKRCISLRRDELDYINEKLGIFRDYTPTEPTSKDPIIITYDR